MRECPWCGAENEDYAEECEQCGLSIKPIVPQKSRNSTLNPKAIIISVLAVVVLIAGFLGARAFSRWRSKRQSYINSTVSAIETIVESIGSQSETPSSSYTAGQNEEQVPEVTPMVIPPISQRLSMIDDYAGEAYTVLNDNAPYFTEQEQLSDSLELYSGLDPLGRCGQAFARIGPETLPIEERESISSVIPTGWVQASYGGDYLYHRCHLIGFQLASENDNKYNLITGTGYMNLSGMLPFENKISKYVKESGNHVLYRVTPLFYEDDLVARGVEMEAMSIEDEGAGIRFHVFVYNIQPGVEIDYATGDSRSASSDWAASYPTIDYSTGKSNGDIEEEFDDINEYHDAEEFYEWHRDDFFDFEEAEEYFLKHQKSIGDA